MLLWDCLCLVLAFISFHVTDDLASASCNPSLVAHRGRFVTCWVAVIWLGRAGSPGSPVSPAHACVGFVWRFARVRGVGAPACQQQLMCLVSVPCRWGCLRAAGQFERGLNSAAPWRSRGQPPPRSPSCPDHVHALYAHVIEFVSFHYFFHNGICFVIGGIHGDGVPPSKGQLAACCLARLLHVVCSLCQGQGHPIKMWISESLSYLLWSIFWSCGVSYQILG